MSDGTMSHEVQDSTFEYLFSPASRLVQDTSQSMNGELHMLPSSWPAGLPSPDLTHHLYIRFHVSFVGLTQGLESVPSLHSICTPDAFSTFRLSWRRSISIPPIVDFRVRVYFTHCAP